MKRYLKKLHPLICIALFVGVIWIVFHVTAKYPILGEPVTYPVNQIDGFKDDLMKMHNEMLKYADYLRKTAKAYRDTQDTVVSQARKLAN